MNADKLTSRRDFLKTSAVIGGALMAPAILPGGAKAEGSSETLKIGLIGCGGLGTGAVGYGGLQSNINGWRNATNHDRICPSHGAIFSRWSSGKKTPIGLRNVRVPGDDCLVESAGYEGEFCSVRRPFARTKGSYTWCIESVGG